MHLDPTAAWLLTYLLHSSALGLLAWLALALGTRVAPALRLAPALRVVLVRGALLGPLVTASVAVLAPTGGTLQVPGALVAGPIIALPAGAAGATPVAQGGQAATPGVAALAPIAATGGPRTGRSTAAVVLGRLPWALAVVAALAALALARRELVARRRLAARRTVEDAGLRAQLDALLPGVTVSECAGLGSPLALGRREVVVPTGSLARLSKSEREALLAHECAHLARRDPAWLGLARVVAAVTAFQPLQRVLLRRLEGDTELAADAWAAARTRHPLALARCLERVSTWLVAGPRPCASVAMARRGSVLVRRVEALCAMPAGAAAPRTGPAGVALAAALGLFACAGPAVRSGEVAGHGTQEPGLDGPAAWAHFDAAMSGGADDLLDPASPTTVVVRALESRGHRVDFSPHTWDTRAPELWLHLTKEDGEVVTRAFGQRFRDPAAVGVFLDRLYDRRDDVRIVLWPDASVDPEDFDPVLEAAIVAGSSPGFGDIDLVGRGDYPVEDGPLLLDHHEIPPDRADGPDGTAAAPAHGPFLVTPYRGPDAVPGERRFTLSYLPASGLDRLPADYVVSSQWVLDFLRNGMRRGPIPGIGIDGLADRLVLELPPGNEFSYVTAWFENAARPDVLAWKTEFKLTTGDEIVSLFLPTDMDVVPEEVPEEGGASEVEPVERVEVRIDRDTDGARYRVGPRITTDADAAARSAVALHRNVGNGRPVKIDARPGVLAGDVFPLVLALREADVRMVLVGTYLAPTVDELVRGKGR